MPKYLRAYRADEVPESGPIPFVASTEGVKRDGLELKAENWDLANYQRNPVFLWAHDYMGQRLPLGRADVEVRDGALHASVTFDNEDEFARQVEGKYRRGFLNAVSVGWDDVGSGEGATHELLDISAVPVPGDPDALIERQFRALKALFDTEASPETFESDVDVWAGIATAMVALNRSDSATEDRKGLWTALERAYRKLGKTPPEFVEREHLEALSEAEWKGLFLEGELEMARVGAVLSARNRADLEKAIELIGSVLERATKEDEPRGEIPVTQTPEEPDLDLFLANLRNALGGKQDG